MIMGDNLGPDFPLSSLDHGGTTGCAGESMSVSSSVAVDPSEVFLHRNASADQDSPTEWTDEKHSLFLESLEASFVKQLHDSMALRDWRLQGRIRVPYSSVNPSIHTCSSSDQNGYQQKDNLKRKEILSDTAVNSHCIKKSPWICHFKSPSKCHTTASSDLQETSLACSEGTIIRGEVSGSESNLELHSESELCHENMVGYITEFSGQNFVDERQKHNSSNLSEAKRRKRVNANASSNDHVVQFGKFKAIDISTANQASSHRKEKTHQESYHSLSTLR